MLLAEDRKAEAFLELLGVNLKRDQRNSSILSDCINIFFEIFSSTDKKKEKTKGKNANLLV